MATYKQPIKEKSRELIWNHAVESLTSKRDDNRILNAKYMEHLWLYCQQQLEEKLDIDTFVKWKEYADICYGKKRPEDLKVAFFCGNEPENDVIHLLRLGIRIENIYAFECDKDSFKEAVDSLHDTYPLLKIYKGKIESYAELQNTKFDIVYLDFTGVLFKEYKTVVRLLDLNALTDMSILIINTTYPDVTEESVDILTNFFFNDTFFESSILSGEEIIREPGDTWFYRAEDCSSHGILDAENLKSTISSNFDFAYSAFQTAFILDYANRHKAFYEVFKKSTISSRLIKNDILQDFGTFEREFHNVLLQSMFEGGQPLSSCQFVPDGFIEKIEAGCYLSRVDCTKIAEVFVESPYRHSVENYADFEAWMAKHEDDEVAEPDFIKAVSFKPILTDECRAVVEDIENHFHGKYMFCDMPMAHLWLEVLLYQYGHPYHTNTENHKRYSYTAKSRKMCVDIFTLDKCRAFYDWMPILEYFMYDMDNHDRQMIARMCIDAIDKHLLHIVDEVYFGAALVGMNEFEWSGNHVIQNRVNLDEYQI